ncbi:uncharacterized protein LOC142981898 [Anticarsia gemmatalis]|uniref:uncharacterized protein LOC142981898 n=1 Tax=Anticarsia gemmatalis TaxID=129554 RepID=UPI003F7608B1
MDLCSKKILLELPPEAIEEMRKIHNLDKPGRVEEAVDCIQEWVLKQDHILKKDFKRIYYETALIANKGSVEKTKKQIDRICTVKTLLPHFFTKTNLSKELKHILDIAWLAPLPKVTKDFYRIILLKINDKQFTEKHCLEYFQYGIIVSEYVKRHDYINGFVVIFDYQETNILELVTKLNPVMFQQFMSIAIEGYGARIKGLHLLTKSKAIDIFVKMVKQFLSEKISNRMHVHKTLEELHQVVPKDLLPVEYGGKERSVHNIIADWTDELSSEDHVNYMKMMNAACTDECLRQSNQFNEEYMGIPGSFRNLSVD